MVKITPKTKTKMSLTAVGQTHSRTHIRVRDVATIVDEPEVRGGTNLAPSPTETLMSSLMACTVVISNKIAKKMGVKFGRMDIDFSAEFNRAGTLLLEEVERPFSDIVMDISVETDADAETLEEIKHELEKFCPIAKVIRGSGVVITENWSAKPLPGAE